MIELASRFRLDGAPIFCARYGSGHINQTHLLVDATARQYILQKINRHVFRDAEALMKNIAAVTAHLKKSATSHREVLTLVPTLEGGLWLEDDAGDHWRLYEFISDSISMNQAASAADFRESAVAFGRFQRQLADFDASTLTQTIPRFHDTPNRYQHLLDAVAADPMGRAREVQPEIDFALARQGYASLLTGLLASGELPLRVTHNDTKLNNVLFDRESRHAVCVIDLDTVMPGLCANDFGDSIRFGATSAAEDEPDLTKVHFSLPLFEAYCEGFLSACGQSLTRVELETLCDGAKMMTLECGVRFLTDHLMGDVYFRTSRPGHNLDRCRTQFKLVADMERHWDDMQAVLKKAARL